MSVGLDMHHSSLKDLVENMLSYQHELQSVVVGLESRLATLEEMCELQRGKSSLLDEFRDVVHQEQQRSKEFLEHRDSVNTKLENMQLQLDSRLAAVLEHVKAQFQGLPYNDRLRENASNCQRSSSTIQTDITNTEAARLKKETMQAVNGSFYRFNESVWDSAVLLFTEVLHWEDSIFIILTLVLNFWLQFLFCILCGSSAFGASVLPTHEAAQRWRFETAHDIKNLNTIRETSLASRVCSIDGALSVSYAQVTVLQQIEHWLEPVVAGFESGYLMTGLAVCLWLLHIAVELTECVRAVLAYASIPSASRMSFSLEAMAQENPHLIIMAMQPWRISFMLLMTLLRLGLAVFLGIKGVQWLGSTLSITELVLNCIGLIFILDMDELLCKLTLTMETQWVLQVLEPLKSGVSKRKRWMRVIVPLSIVVSCGVILTIFIHTYILETKADMWMIKEEFCGGNKDFVVARQLGTQMFSFTQTRDASQDRLVQENPLQQFGSHIVEGILNSGTYNSNGVWQENYSSNMNVTHVVSNDGPSLLQYLSVIDMDILTDYWGTFHGCQDEISFVILRKQVENPTYRERLQRLRTLEVSSGVTNASDCSDLKSLCYSEMLPLLRTICPVTCGCQSPLSGQLYSTARSGCPERACRVESAFTKELGQIPCADHTPAELEQMPGWRTFWWTAFDYVSRRNNWNLEEGIFDAITGQTYFKEDLTAMVMSLGCTYPRVEPVARSFCQRTAETAILSPFCPTACGCHTSYRRGCPTQCRQNSSIDLEERLRVI